MYIPGDVCKAWSVGVFRFGGDLTDVAARAEAAAKAAQAADCARLKYFEVDTLAAALSNDASMQRLIQGLNVRPATASVGHNCFAARIFAYGNPRGLSIRVQQLGVCSICDHSALMCAHTVLWRVHVPAPTPAGGRPRTQVSSSWLRELLSPCVQHVHFLPQTPQCRVLRGSCSRLETCMWLQTASLGHAHAHHRSSCRCQSCSSRWKGT